MKRLLKSILVLAVVVGVSTAATGAYFSSTVTAADNEINVGTLMMAVDSTRAHNYVGFWGTGTGLSWDGVTAVGAPFDAYNVVYDNDGSMTYQNALEPWENAEPGTYTAYTGGTGIETLDAGNYSIWFTVRNRGTIPAKGYVAFNGDWIDMREYGTDGVTLCTDHEGANGRDRLIRLKNVHVYQNGSTGCENHEECRNLRDALNGVLGGDYLSSDSTISSSPVNVGYDQNLAGSGIALSSDLTTGSGDPIVLDAGEYAIVRVDMQFDPVVTAADYNCYQGATYQYDVSVSGTQVGDPAWF